MMKATYLLTLWSCLPMAWAQLSLLTQLQCGNLLSGVCRLQCLSTELSVYPASCSLYTFVFGATYRRCVASMPCCYFSGSCQSSCTGSQVQLSSAATCSNGGICCVASTLLTPGSPLANPTVTTTAATTTTTSTSSSVASRQGSCGTLALSNPGLVSPRLLGGREATPTDWPWLVRVTYTTDSNGFCAGVLVDSDTVVTTAHCVQGVSTSVIRVLVGDFDPSVPDVGEETVNVASYSVAPGFVRGVRGFDLAVVKLARAVTFTDRKLPGCLPDPTIPLRSPSLCYMAGWGFSEVGFGQRLRSLNTVVIDRVTCQAQIANLPGRDATLPADMLCTLNPPVSPADGCLFDDGDMLACLDVQNRWTLVGVMSEYSCGQGFPVLFTNVSSYTDFILGLL